MTDTSSQEAQRQASAVSVVDAIELVQAGHRLYVTALTGRQLIDSTSIDYYDSRVPPGDDRQGYQRPPERSRITRIGSYLIKGQGDGLYPSAILLASRGAMRYDPVSKRLELPLNHSLRVVDGQHRREGLRYAIEEKHEEALAFLPVPVVIVEVQDRIEEMDQFRIINGTAKSVRTDLVNAILTAMAEEHGEDAIPEKDIWRVVVTKVVDALDRRDDSPWQDLLLMPDEIGVRSAPGKITRATSAIASIRPIYDWLEHFGFLDSKNPSESAELIANILVAFWRAVRNVVPDAFSEPSDYVIQKTPGLFALHYLLRGRLLPDIFKGRREWDEATFEEFISDSPEITDVDFWHKSSNRAAAYGSMKGFRDLSDLLIESLERL